MSRLNTSSYSYGLRLRYVQWVSLYVIRYTIACTINGRIVGLYIDNFWRGRLASGDSGYWLLYADTFQSRN